MSGWPEYGPAQLTIGQNPPPWAPRSNAQDHEVYRSPCRGCNGERVTPWVKPSFRNGQGDADSLGCTLCPCPSHGYGQGIAKPQPRGRQSNSAGAGDAVGAQDLSVQRAASVGASGRYRRLGPGTKNRGEVGPRHGLIDALGQVQGRDSMASPNEPVTMPRLHSFEDLKPLDCRNLNPKIRPPPCPPKAAV